VGAVLGELRGRREGQQCAVAGGMAVELGPESRGVVDFPVLSVVSLT
jgi:hypothetical protein